MSALAAPAGVGTLDKARNKCLRVITGQYNSTPLDVLWLEAGAMPVKNDILRSAVSASEPYGSPFSRSGQGGAGQP